MCIVYVNDLILCTSNNDSIHDLEMDFRELGTDLEQ